MGSCCSVPTGGRQPFERVETALLHLEINHTNPLPPGLRNYGKKSANLGHDLRPTGEWRCGSLPIIRRFP